MTCKRKISLGSWTTNQQGDKRDKLQLKCTLDPNCFHGEKNQPNFQIKLCHGKSKGLEILKPDATKTGINLRTNIQQLLQRCSLENGKRKIRS